MSSSTLFTNDLLSALDGIVPAVIATCSADGIPNITFISQVFYVDEEHVAISCQFMNKTVRNLQDNPRICVTLSAPATFSMWQLHLSLEEWQTEGPVFDQMDMQLQALMSMMAVKPDFKILAALICRIDSIELIYQGIAS